MAGAQFRVWHQVATPREVLRENRPLDAAEFAVHLDDIHEKRNRPPRRRHPLGTLLIPSCDRS